MDRLRLESNAYVRLITILFLGLAASLHPAAPRSIPPNPQENPGSISAKAEYLWYEAENMRGFATNARHEPVLNASWLNPSKTRAPGWGINGPGVSAEWTQGGESEWNSAAASADESSATIYQDLEIPRAGDFKIWVRYADWGRKTETFVIKISQQNREVFSHEFGATDIIDAHDEVSMYWGWAFTWDGAGAKLDKGPARLSLVIEKTATARRHVDAVLVTNDLSYVPFGRRKPDFAAMKYLRDSAKTRSQLQPLLDPQKLPALPVEWQPSTNGREFLMPWNITREFWPLYEKPPGERPLYPFSTEAVDEFVKAYKGVRDVPIFSSKLVVPVIYLNDLAAFVKEGSPFLRYLRDTKTPFAVLINYASTSMTEADAQAAWKLLDGELRDQFLGWISGESVGYVWHESATELKINPSMSRKELLAAHREFYTKALDKKWSLTFQSATGPMWNKLIPAQSTSSTSFSHALMEWGTKLLGIETSAVQPMTAMRLAFTRGAARQYGGAFLYYHAPNFGDSATTFTKTQNFAGPDNFFHSRYGMTMGPSLSWYRKSYYLYYMGGASAIYLEQGYDQFFKPGPGENPLQLNPLGRITDEFIRFAERHPDRGTPYAPVAILLDPAHGWEMTDYPHWPFGVSQVNRSDRALRELFGALYYPGTVVEGEPATADRQAFVSSVFGDIFDVLVASDGVSGSRSQISDSPRSTVPGSPYRRVSASPSPAPPASPLTPYRAVVAGGEIEWTPEWVQKLATYVRQGGVVVLNAAQTKGLPVEFLGINLRGSTDSTGEADTASCLLPSEESRSLAGQVFRYRKVETKTAQILMQTPTGDPLVTMNKVGEGKVIFVALPDLLGIDERIPPFATHLLEHLLAHATPVRVEGDVEYLINRKANSWVVTLMNNNGVIKPQQGMAQVDRTAMVTATISMPGQPLRAAVDWINDKPVEVSRQSSVLVRLNPGAVAVIELK